MRCSAAFGTTAPMSFITSFLTGEPGRLAMIMPMRPPIDVPSQSSVSACRLAMSVVMSLQYVGYV
jgi:hypothetical protein